jgi:molybdopterin-guanine dinucleotide biosynthesis protein A
MIESITGVVLAGGRSTRMGTNKALLPYSNKKLIDAPLETLSNIFSEVVLSVRDAEEYSDYSLPKVIDFYHDIGPVGGITSVLSAGYKRIFCVACDMPFLNKRFIEHLCNYTDEAVIPVWKGRAEVLHAVYSEPLLDTLQKSISQGRYKVTDALGDLEVRYINEGEIARFDPNGDSFRNVNTPADYEKL